MKSTPACSMPLRFVLFLTLPFFLLATTTLQTSKILLQGHPPAPCLFEPEDQTIKCQTTNIAPTTASSRDIMRAQIDALQAHLDATAPLSLQAAVGNSENDTSTDDENFWKENEGDDNLAQNKTLIYIATIVVSAIVLISVGFEKWHEWLDEHVPEVLSPVLKSIFGELTVLGFIGLIMFVTTKVGKHSLDFLVCNGGEGWWSEDEEVCPRNSTTGKWNPKLGCPENPLIELTEQAHMILFGVMVLFLIEAIVLIQIGMSRMRSMQTDEQRCISDTIGKSLENQSRSTSSMKNASCMYFQCSNFLRCCPKLFKRCSGYEQWKKHDEESDFLDYQANRRGFIMAYNSKSDSNENTEHNLKADFDYAQYSTRVLAERLGEIVELTPDNWFVIWLVFVIYLAFDFIDLVNGNQNMLLIACAIIGCYFCCILIVLVVRRVRFISTHLVHPFHLPHGHPLRTKALAASSGVSFSTAIAVKRFSNIWKSKSTVQSRTQDEKGGDMVSETSTLHERLLNIKEEKLEGNESKFQRRKSLVIGGNVNGSPKRGGHKRYTSQVKNDLMKQAGVVQSKMVDKHHPHYKFHFGGDLRDEPEETAVCGCFLKHQPTLYENMFWGGKYGVNLLFGYVRTQMVIIALYLGVFIVVLSTPIAHFFHEKKEDYNSIEVWGPLLVYTVAFLPLVFLFSELTLLIPLLVRISSTEQNINGECVNSTLRIMKSRRALRALHNISCFMANIDKTAEKCLKAARESQTFRNISPEEEQKLMRNCELHNFRPGTVICKQGACNDRMYIISEGDAEVIVDGDLKAMLTAGKEFGKISMMSGRPTNASVIVHDQMICFTLKKEVVKEVLGDNFQQEEEQFVDIAGGRRSLTPDHMEQKQKGKHVKRRSSLLDQSKWNSIGPWVKRGKWVELAGKRVYGLDSKQDGVINAFALDTNNDGIINAIGYDDSGDGTIDTYDDSAYDFRMFNLMLKSKKAHEGGSTESLGLDLNGDGKIDAYMVDTTGDGRFDSVGFDTSGDGKVDAFDTSGDGLPDVRKGSMADIMRKNRPVAVSMQQRKVALIDLFHAIDKGGDGTIEGPEMEDFLSAVSLLFVSIIYILFFFSYHLLHCALC